MTVDATIDYEALQQEAMRGLVRAVLVQIAKTGLPGDHHLYISFDVRAPGVVLSKRLREKYPQEMTIVLQHRFWDLGINDERFEVKLTFDGIPERLVVPFTAIKVFLDPSVRYVLHFEQSGLNADDHTAENSDDAGPRAVEQRTTANPSAKKPRAARPKVRGDGVSPSAVTLASVPQDAPSTVSPMPSKASNTGSPAALPAAKTKSAASPPAATETPVPRDADQPAQADKPDKTGQVVSLDAFRKK
jgi:uncharacterized protein